MLWQAIVAESVAVAVGLICANLSEILSTNVTDRHVVLRYARAICFAAITFRIPASGAIFPCSQSYLMYCASHANQHTIGHHLCPVCEGERKRIMDKEQLASSPLRTAADIWLEWKRPFLSKRTSVDYKNYVKILSAFFADITLRDIHIGNIRSYQNWRQEQEVGPVAINHELGLLRQIMSEAGLWRDIKPHYRQVPMGNEERGIALSPEQLELLFKTAKKDTRWEVALHASILSAQTTLGPGEIKGLRIKDIDLSSEPPIVNVCKGKNRYRVRTIPLARTALYSVRFLIDRAREKGAVEPDHFLLPARSRSKGSKPYDPTRPQTHWNRAWDRVRVAAGLPKLRQYDLRHTAITRLLEKPFMPERVVIEIAGHVSNKMLTRYSHQRIEAKRVALAALDDLETG